jgi:hypothetical protein
VRVGARPSANARHATLDASPAHTHTHAHTAHPHGPTPTTKHSFNQYEYFYGSFVSMMDTYGQVRAPQA